MTKLANITNRKSKPFLKPIILLLGIIVIIIVAYGIASSQGFYREKGQDFFALWLAPHLIMEGKNPYDANVWTLASISNGVHVVKDTTFLYPLPLAVILIPLGLLPLEYAAVAWIALGIIAILISCNTIFSITRTKLLIAYLIPIYSGIFTFRSTVETLRIGQLDWLILLFLAAGLYFWDKHNWYIGGFLIGLSALKPQIGAPILILLTVWLLIRRIWKGLIGEITALIGLLIIGWLFNNSWLFDWLASGGNKVFTNIFYTPTIWGFGSLVCNFNNNCGLLAGSILVGLLGILTLLLFARISTDQARYAIGVTIPVALLISPYLWVYSQTILLIPILLIVAILTERRFSYIIVAPFPLLLSLFSASIVFISIRMNADIISFAVPLLVFTIFALVYWKYRGKSSLA